MFYFFIIEKYKKNWLWFTVFDRVTFFISLSIFFYVFWWFVVYFPTLKNSKKYVLCVWKTGGAYFVKNIIVAFIGWCVISIKVVTPQKEFSCRLNRQNPLGFWGEIFQQFHNITLLYCFINSPTYRAKGTEVVRSIE